MPQKPGKWFLIHNPMLYQGWHEDENYFEGWYFKVVDPSSNLAMAFIPGISKESTGEAHSFVQILDGIDCKSYYFEYDAEAFVANPKILSISVGGNSFSEDQLVLSTETIKANLKFGPWAKLAKHVLRPGIMGWYSYMPFMECYHGLGSVFHKVNGTIIKGGREFTINNAIGYVEKDWGTSFPKSWIWTQCNTFEDEEAMSVFASVAHIPWRGSFFIGFLAIVYYQGKMEIFATYNNSVKQVFLKDDGVFLEFKKRKKNLRIEVTKASGADLRSPISGHMQGKVNESLQAKMKVTYKIKNRLIVAANGQYSGLEVAGPVEILLSE